jgi:hypothetical protein
MWNGERNGNVTGIVLLMQEGTILKGAMFNKIYLRCMTFYFTSPRTFSTDLIH